MHSENLSQKAKPLSDKEIAITEQSPVVLKKCTKCKEYKELDLFHKNKSRKDGKHPYCKRCHGEKVSAWKKANPEKHAARSRAWAKANPEKEAARHSAWQKAHPEKSMLYSAKQRAKQSNLEFNLEINDIQIPERCPVLGITLERGNTNADKDSSPSLDKILPEKGYVKGNVQVISNLANRMKSNATFAQMVAFANWVKRQELLGMVA
jgi:hypothetical protein